MLTTAHAVAFLLVWAAFVVAHQVADHWVQTCHQAANKGGDSWPGRIACARHVATYTATTSLLVAMVLLVFATPVTAGGFVTGQIVSAVTHYWADRRTTLKAAAYRFGNGEFYELGAPRALYTTALNVNGDTVIDIHTGEPILANLDNTNVGTGAYQLDQAFHWLMLFLAALATVAVSAI